MRPRLRIAELDRVRLAVGDPTSRTLHFTFRGGPKNGRSNLTFVEVEHVPDFEGETAWFELEQVTAKPWSYWRAVRQVEDPHAFAQRTSARQTLP